MTLHSPLAVLAAPVFLLGLMLGFGIWAVIAIAQHQEDYDREVAKQLTISTAETFEVLG